MSDDWRARQRLRQLRRNAPAPAPAPKERTPTARNAPAPIVPRPPAPAARNAPAHNPKAVRVPPSFNHDQEPVEGELLGEEESLPVIGEESPSTPGNGVPPEDEVFEGEILDEEDGSAMSQTQTKACPFCGEQIAIVAKKCKHCREFLDEDDSVTTTGHAVSATRRMGRRRDGTRQESKKRKLPLLLFWLFLGGLGVHSFYAGRWGQGIIMLLLLLTSWLVWPLIIMAAFLLGDLIRILMGAYADGEGFKITRWT